jgi:hypothetical protein
MGTFMVGSHLGYTASLYSYDFTTVQPAFQVHKPQVRIKHRTRTFLELKFGHDIYPHTFK